MSKVVVVTGGTRGIGRGLAKEFLAAGCKVAICGRTADAVDTAVEALGSSVVGVVADVTDEAGMQKLWDATTEAFGRVDIWVNNAGVSAPRAPFVQADLDEAAGLYRFTWKGAFLSTWKLVPPVKQIRVALRNRQSRKNWGKIGMSS